MAKKTTPTERKAYIEQQREYDRRGLRELPLSFIDREGNIVRPTRDNPYPAKGRYQPRSKSEKYVTVRRYHGAIAIIGILTAIFFLSSNITGNAVANLTNQTSSFIGIGLLLIGLIAGFFWLNNKKN